MGAELFALCASGFCMRSTTLVQKIRPTMEACCNFSRAFRLRLSSRACNRPVRVAGTLKFGETFHFQLPLFLPAKNDSLVDQDLDQLFNVEWTAFGFGNNEFG